MIAKTNDLKLPLWVIEGLKTETRRMRAAKRAKALSDIAICRDVCHLAHSYQERRLVDVVVGNCLPAQAPLRSDLTESAVTCVHLIWLILWILPASDFSAALLKLVLGQCLAGSDF